MADNVVTDDLVAINNSSTVAKINLNTRKLAEEFDKVLYADGRKALTDNMDANNQRIINIGAPVLPGDALRLQDIGSILKGDKGDPGADTSGVGRFIDIAGMNIDAGIKQIFTFGMAVNFVGGAKYKEYIGAPLPSWGQNIWWTTSDGGARTWQLDTDEPRLSHFGSVADGARVYLATNASGTDNLNAFHYGINYCFIKNFKNLYVENGNYFVSNTIHLGGMADAWHSVNIIGLARSPFPLAGYNQQIWPQVTILTNFNDRPCLNIQAARAVRLENVVVNGPMWGYVATNQLGSHSSAAFDDRLTTQWLPALPNNTMGRYNSGAGITVDAYSGVKAGVNPYPDPVFPTHYAAKTSGSGFGQKTSSEVNIESCGSLGFSAGYIVDPSDNGSQGDFVRINNSRVEGCIWGISVGNDQSRNIQVHNLNWVRVHTVFTNNTHGKQIGRFGGPITNCSGGSSIQIFDYQSGFGGGLIFDNIYWEACWRLGNANGSNGEGIVFRNMQAGMTLATYSATRGIPQNHYGSSAGATTRTSVPITIKDASNFADLSVWVLNATNVIIEDTQFTPTQRSGTAVSAAKAMWHNSLCGGIVAMGDLFADDGTNLIAPRIYPRYTTAGTMEGWRNFDGLINQRPTRDRGTPVYGRHLEYVGYKLSTTEVKNFRYPGDAGNLQTGGGSINVTNRLMTWVLPTGFQIYEEAFNFKPGDGFIHNSGVVGYIYSWNSGTRTMLIELQNGFNGAPGAEALFPGISLVTGSYIFFSGRLSLPNLPLFADFPAGTTAVTNVQTGAGNTGNYDTQIAVGDRLFVNRELDGDWGTDFIVNIAARSHAAKTITLTANSTVVKNRRIVIRPNLASQGSP